MLIEVDKRELEYMLKGKPNAIGLELWCFVTHLCGHRLPYGGYAHDDVSPSDEAERLEKLSCRRCQPALFG